MRWTYYLVRIELVNFATNLEIYLGIFNRIYLMTLAQLYHFIFGKRITFLFKKCSYIYNVAFYSDNIKSTKIIKWRLKPIPKNGAYSEKPDE